MATLEVMAICLMAAPVCAGLLYWLDQPIGLSHSTRLASVSGVQPTKGNLDPTKPPTGGTGVLPTKPQTGVKFDQGKLPMDLIPPEAITALAVRLKIGAKKHAARNWEKGLRSTQVYAALMRHLIDWASGIDVDPDPDADGSTSLEGVLINAAFLVALEKRGWGTLDDRPKTKASSIDKHWCC